MTSKKRVFSNDNNLNYIDYIKIKNGSECLKLVKKDDKNGIINKFANYDQFLALSSGFYKYSNLDKCDIYPTRDLYNSNLSFVTRDNYDSIKKNECELIKPVLYPYGVYHTNKITNQRFPSKICLENWCNKKRNCLIITEKFRNINTDNNNDSTNNDSTNNDNTNNYNNNNNNNNNNSSIKDCNCYNKKCKTGLCKNARPLFI